MANQLSLFQEPPKTRLDVPAVIQQAIAAGATVAVSISGGKDSQAIASLLAALSV